MNRLVLIDGNAMLHRAYHAIPPFLTAPDGSVVNAVYGFGTMLVKLIGDLKPTHLAVAFDRAAPTFRKKLFEGYQSKRPKLDDALIEQIPKVHHLVESFGIPIYEKDGFEADDVMGTLARDAKKENFDSIIIVTGDRDILQLVEDNKIFVYMPTKGLSEAKLYGDKEVIERMGVAPRHVPDFKALAGDPSDNYAGVAGVGPKTAAHLVTEFGTVENLYKALDTKHKKTADLAPALREKLVAGRDNAMLSKELALIRTDVPLEGAVAPLGSLNRPEAVKALTQFGFRTLLKRITGEKDQTPARQRVSETTKQKKEKTKKLGEQQGLF